MLSPSRTSYETFIERKLSDEQWLVNNYVFILRRVIDQTSFKIDARSEYNVLEYDDRKISYNHALIR